MAIVRARRQVAPTPIPGVRLTSAETELSTGAAFERARGQKFETVAGVAAQGAQISAGLYAEIVRQAREDADRTALLEAQNKLDAWELQAIYDPQHGALSVKGKAAFELPERVDGDFKKQAMEIEQGLTTPRQRMAFAQLRQQRADAVAVSVRRHVASQMDAFTAAELDATVNNAADLAIANAMDPRRVGIELNRAVYAIRTTAPALGLGPEAITARVRTVQSAVHAGVIGNLLANDQDRAARVYFEETKDDISGDRLDEITKAIELGTLRGESQRRADVILGSATTRADALAAARTVADPKLRDEVETRVGRYWNEREQTGREQVERIMVDAGNHIDQTGSLDGFSPALLAKLTVGEKSALEAYATRKSKGQDVETEWGTYYSLFTLGTNDATRDQFARTNLLGYRDRLGKTEFKQLAELQAAIRKGDTAVATRIGASEQVQTRIVDDGLRAIGLDPTPPEPGQKTYNAATTARVVQFRRAVRGAVGALEARTGKPATDADVQSITDGLLFPSGATRTRSTGVFSSTQDPVYNFESDAPGHVDRIGQVPVAERRRIAQDLEARGFPATDAAIVYVFNKSLKRVRGPR